MYSKHAIMNKKMIKGREHLLGSRLYEDNMRQRKWDHPTLPVCPFLPSILPFSLLLALDFPLPFFLPFSLVVRGF